MSGQILVVDGSATNRITLKVRLAGACYDPLTCRTGAEALAILSRARPTLVLIGGEPGDMGATQLCSRIAAACPGLPVLMAVPPEDRVAALRAGAAGVLETPTDEMNLFARIRQLMRDQNETASRWPTPGLAEDQAEFTFAARATVPAASVLVVAADASVAVGWRQALAPRLDAQLRVADPERALTEAAVGLAPDLYLIVGNAGLPDDGLRMLSELRSRRSSCTAGFAVVLAPERQHMMSVALDLGAGDVLPATPGDPGFAEEAALRLSALIRRKRSADRHRQAAEHELSLARVDPLTGLVNRRIALPLLAEICAAGRSCAVVTLDIDRFKGVNDIHGHAAGDVVLSEVAARLDAIVAAPGFVARMGGEEFLVVLPDGSADEAEAVACDLCHAVSDSAIALSPGGTRLRTTVSAGLARRSAGGPGDGRARAAALLARADQALLDAKRSGRNRLIVASLDAAA